MFIILGSDGVEYGPADAATVKAWVEQGRATLQSRARRADSAEWKTLGDFAEFAAGAVPPPLPGAIKKDPVRIDARAYAEELIARAKPLDIMGCIGRGWAFYTSDFGPILGVTLVAFLLIGAVPFGGLLVTGLGMAGLYYYYLGKMRGQPRRLPDLFVGLERMTGPLIIGNLAVSGITVLCIIPLYILVFVALLVQNTAGVVVGLAGALACMAAMFYISAIFVFLFPLMIDKNMDWRDAMTVSRRLVHSQFWRFAAMMILLALISCLGLLVFIIGVYLLLPLTIATVAQAYEDLCNPPRK